MWGQDRAVASQTRVSRAAGEKLGIQSNTLPAELAWPYCDTFLMQACAFPSSGVLQLISPYSLLGRDERTPNEDCLKLLV